MFSFKYVQLLLLLQNIQNINLIEVIISNSLHLSIIDKIPTDILVLETSSLFLDKQPFDLDYQINFFKYIGLFKINSSYFNLCRFHVISIFCDCQVTKLYKIRYLLHKLGKYTFITYYLQFSFIQLYNNSLAEGHNNATLSCFILIFNCFNVLVEYFCLIVTTSKQIFWKPI